MKKGGVDIYQKKAGVPIYRRKAGSPVYTPEESSELSTGAMTVTEVTSTSSLPNGGFGDDDLDGGQLYVSSDGTGPFVLILAFGGTGTMSGAGRSSLLGQSIGYGFSNYSDWVISSGIYRIACLQMYDPGSPPYSSDDPAKQSFVDAANWLRATYTNADAGNKIIIAASSQGGDIFGALGDDDGDIAGAAWCRNNLKGVYHAAAGFPASGPDLTGMNIVTVHGANDTQVSYATVNYRLGLVNTASTGTPAVMQTVADTAHVPYTYNDPFTVNRSFVYAINDYDGFLTYLNNLHPAP